MNAVLLSFVFFASAYGVSSSGSKAKGNQFPHMVSIHFINTDKYTCGGTIINSRWIVTAAHCILGNNTDNYYIQSGTTSLTKEGILHKVERIIIHKEYEALNNTNDIALIRVQNDIEFIPNKVSPLEISSEPLTGGEEVIFGGWGYTQLEGPLSEKLQWMKITVLPQDICEDLQRPFPVSKGMICTAPKTGDGICNGHSGSFLKRNGKLVGVLSWSWPCALGYPDVSTRMSYYYDWVEEQMKN